MKKFNKVILVIFSVIILIAGVAINLIDLGWLDIDIAGQLIGQALLQEVSGKIILLVTEICMIFAVLGIFADSTKKEPKNNKDVLMQNDNGRLMISRETLENLVNAVVRTYSGVRQSQTKIQLDAESNVIVFVDLTVGKDIIIKEMTVDMQRNIKESIKKTSDLEVKQVNVRIKNIVEPTPEKTESK